MINIIQLMYIFFFDNPVSDPRTD